MKEYSTPILTSVFNIFGALSFVVGAFLIIGGIQSGARENVILGAGCILSSVIEFGFAQVIEFLGKSAHYTEQTALMIQRGQSATVRAHGRTVSNG
jgi:hypothetical protein